MRINQLIPYAIALSGVASAAHSQELGNPAAGYQLAQSVCSECHAIEVGEKLSPNDMAPPFQLVADTRGMTGLALSVWSITPHETMPNIAFNPEERADIIAYILSLKSK